MKTPGVPAHFEFSTAGNVIFGPGTVSRLPALAATLGGRVLLITGSKPGRIASLRSSLEKAGLTVTDYAIRNEPFKENITEGSALAVDEKCSVVISVGGGSVLDAGKAIASMITNGGDIMDYLEVIGKGSPPRLPSAPFIAVPTTAGTGTEVTRNAVITSREHGVKVSMRGPHLMPRVAIVDPELTLTMPPPVTASTGLDALTQLIEAFVSVAANPMTDAVCREGLRHAAPALPAAYKDGADLAARQSMSLASLFSGMALANAKLGAVHGFAGPIGGLFPLAHGAVCACLLPHVMRANVEKIERGSGNPHIMDKFREIARILTGSDDAVPDDAVTWIERTCAAMEIASLGEMGISEEDIPSIAGQAQKSSSMKGNPVELDLRELEAILRRALV